MAGQIISTTTTESGGTVENEEESTFSGVGEAITEATYDQIGGNLATNIDLPGGREWQDKSVFRNWLEKVYNYSPWNDVFSMQQQESTLVIDVPFENRYLFLAYALGFSYVDDQNRLRRVNPIRHPYWHWMYAARVGHQGVRFEGSKIVVAEHKPGVAKYKLARFTVGFANYPWRFEEDSQDSDPDNLADREMERNTFWELQPTSQFLAAEGGAAVLKFAYDSSASGGPFGGYADTEADPPERPEDRVGFRAPFGTPMSMINYRFHWKWVPFDFIHAGRIPVNIYRALNTLNNALFMGEFAKGTMLLDPPEITVYAAPLRTKGLPSLLCDVVFNLKYFDPPRGIAEGDGSDIRGHNLVPWRENNKWYPAVRRNEFGNIDEPPDTDNKSLFQYSDFRKLFQRPTALEE